MGTRPHSAAEPERDSSEKDFADVEKAIFDGRLTEGGIAATRASDQDVAVAEAEADYLANLRALGERSIPVTIRMPSDLMLALRRTADQEGVRYQTLMKEWIREKLTPQSRERAYALRAEAERLIGTVAELVLGEHGLSVTQKEHGLSVTQSLRKQDGSSEFGERSGSRRRAKSELKALSERERQVLGLLISGGVSKAEIARRLHLSATAVNTHVEHILGKLDLGAEGQGEPDAQAAAERRAVARARTATERRVVAGARARKATR